MELWGTTDSGKVRRQNQDVFKIIFDELAGVAVMVVCDGMGGARAGNVASAIAADAFIGSVGKHIENIDERSDIALKMSGAVLEANKAVFEKSIEADEYFGMGTTLTAAMSASCGEVIANIGDSRAYHVTQNSITQVTKDHSVVEDMISRGDLTRAEARRHPNKHLITRALGTSYDDEPDVFLLDLEPGEHILLCTDGLSNVVLDSEILFELQRGASVRESCENLVGLALERGAPDNVTAVVFRK